MLCYCNPSEMAVSYGLVLHLHLHKQDLEFLKLLVELKRFHPMLLLHDRVLLFGAVMLL